MKTMFAVKLIGPRGPFTVYTRQRTERNAVKVFKRRLKYAKVRLVKNGFGIVGKDNRKNVKSAR